MSSEHQPEESSLQGVSIHQAGNMSRHAGAESVRTERGDKGLLLVHNTKPPREAADSRAEVGEDACGPKNQKILHLGRGGLILLAIFLILNTVIWVFGIIYIGNALSALSQVERPRENITVVVVVHDLDSDIVWNAVSNTVWVNGTADNSCGSSGFNATCNCPVNTHIFIRNDTRIHSWIDKSPKRNK